METRDCGYIDEEGHADGMSVLIGGEQGVHELDLKVVWGCIFEILGVYIENLQTILNDSTRT